MTGRRVWWYFVAFFGFIAAINAVMVTLAIRTHSGVVTDHAYEKGLAYNQTIQAQEKQQALAWKAAIDYKNGMLHFVLYDKRNNPILPEQAVATITRPTKSDMDFVVPLNGTETAIDFPAKGLWMVRVDVQHEGAHYQQSKRIVVK